MRPVQSRMCSHTENLNVKTGESVLVSVRLFFLEHIGEFADTKLSFAARWAIKEQRPLHDGHRDSVSPTHSWAVWRAGWPWLLPDHYHYRLSKELCLNRSADGRLKDVGRLKGRRMWTAVYYNITQQASEGLIRNICICWDMTEMPVSKGCYFRLPDLISMSEEYEGAFWQASTSTTTETYSLTLPKAAIDIFHRCQIYFANIILVIWTNYHCLCMFL